MAFKAFFKGIAKYPKYKKKTNRQSFRVPQFFNFTDNLLYLPKMGKGIKMEAHREFPRAKIYERITNQRNDFLHKVSTFRCGGMSLYES